MESGIERDLAAAREIALYAGTELESETGKLRTIDHKSATDMVTDLDRRVERRICAELARRFPDDGILAEEGGRREGRRRWIVDPLDGTTNYVHGHPFYAVSLARVDEDGPQIAAVYAPALDELYTASRGGGALLERPAAGTKRRLGPRTEVSLSRALLATGFPYVRDGVVSLNCRLVEAFLLEECHGVRRGGSAAIDLCHVAAGRLDGYWEMKLKPWDVAGGALMVRETGAAVTDFEGDPAALEGHSILAAAPGLHETMRAMIAAVRAREGS